jgi:mono/diheme cytochrome c family protein
MKAILGGVTAALLLIGSSAFAADNAADYSGSDLYRMYCKSCHGLSAKGDGALAPQMRVRPTDLTTLAKRDGGEWKADKVGRIIDGRNPLKGHGGPDMPIWGDAFKSSTEGFDDGAVKAKIKALVEHLESLQEK